MYLFKKTENWDEFKTKLKMKYPQLTDADLRHEEGREDNMLRMVEYKLQKSKIEMKDIIEEIGFLPVEK